MRPPCKCPHARLSAPMAAWVVRLKPRALMNPLTPSIHGHALQALASHLPHEHAERVDVDGGGDARAGLEHLRREVRHGAGAAVVDHLLVAAHNLGQPKVGQLRTESVRAGGA